jgi:hypothetical protein
MTRAATTEGRRSRKTGQPRLAPAIAYRWLLARGLSPGEAGNLTALACGLGASSRPWTLQEIQSLIFLRELERRGRFGLLDGAPAVRR